MEVVGYQRMHINGKLPESGAPDRIMLLVMVLVITMMTVKPGLADCRAMVFPGYAHEASEDYSERGDIRVVFYNVENLFDTQDDSLTADEDFLPSGIRAWHPGRYRKKLGRISQVIYNMGWELPEIIGMAEVENRAVLQDLLDHTALGRGGYALLHADSPDARGIDLGVLYRPARVTILEFEAIPVILPPGEGSTRDVYYLKAGFRKEDTMHLFFCHFPSRRGGQAASEPRRLCAASVVRARIDSIRSVQPSAYILVAGDFNDEPSDRSVSEILGGDGRPGESDTHQLFNYMNFVNNYKTGTYKYGGMWNMLDQILVSNNLVNGTGSLSGSRRGAVIFRPDWMVMEDTQSPGGKPKGTYHGMVYQGGYSDHFPVWLDLYFR